ncbi:DUF1758 domain-containing protein [Trichonephila clavata]|uniref:DUF1758 domain-containing protein n=1 Tax=Trichonephila clavata TaxID=2740835 RepID=A0A8X6FDN3_TRICU|nr:DUF1758 domain-containing protein [Trichonephila clavata]
MDKLNRSKRAVKSTITKSETFVEESKDHTPTKLDIKLKRIQEMNKKIDELKNQYYENKDISDSELAEIDTGLQEMEDRLEDLEQLSRDEGENHPLAAAVTTRDIYMDDILTGSSDFQEFQLLQSELIGLFKKSDDLSKCSDNYTKLLHVLSYSFGFIKNCINPIAKRSCQLDYSEVNEAELWFIKNLQASAFKKEIDDLAKGGCISKKGKLFSLNPFLDGNQILRVGGRLQNSDLTYSQNHPAILPADHLLTKLHC